ncbi:LacI family DNA-binding transcriptional regulator [Allomuricauda sp. F6463D]|uniref:LacI family DNA-binding transcriptional regulator n=1 Tax=Allomuricauda sp. F6463D TaxID=2926409 RepID=UPI001FF106CB|nr:LacI family DNA-binding transcriptional regulator [Muricauda sp. F6463D]MCK0159063.1 LacI family transcriptional regulator [Muricauda sp. F6463D]
MRKGRVTLKDIAVELNLSPSTVSRALHDHPAIGEGTKKAVKELAADLDYQPNPMALGLLQKRSNTIGVIVPEITSHFFSAIITGIQDVVGPTRYNIMICISNESFDEEVTLVKKLSGMRVDGILVSPASGTKTFEHFQNLQKNDIPVVVFDRDCPGLESDKVLVDDYSGAFQAVEYLIGSGCKKIAHLGGPLNLSTTKHRMQGYLDALEQNNMPIRNEYIHHVKGFSHEDGLKPTKRLLALDDTPDAIFAINDNIATSAIHVAKKKGMRIPQDISIVGFDDDPHSLYFSPSLSTVWQPVYSMGMLSARILLQRLKDKTPVECFRKEVFKPELVVRASSKED